MEKVFITSCILVILSLIVCVACLFIAIWADHWTVYVRTGITSMLALFVSAMVMRLTEPK